MRQAVQLLGGSGSRVGKAVLGRGYFSSGAVSRGEKKPEKVEPEEVKPEEVEPVEVQPEKVEPEIGHTGKVEEEKYGKTKKIERKEEVRTSKDNIAGLLERLQSKKNILEEVSGMTIHEFEQALNAAPKPSLNRDDAVLRKFRELLKTYINKDSLRREFKSSSSLLAQFPNLAPTAKTEAYSAAELAIRQRHHAALMGNLGSTVRNVYRPHQLVSNPPKATRVSLERMLACGVHLGHSVALWNRKTQPFLYGQYDGIHIIDLNQTLAHLRRAAAAVRGVAENGGLILFLGVKEGQMRAVREAARRCNGYFVIHKWTPGTITNALENPKPRHEVDMADVPTKRQLTGDESSENIKPDLIVMLNPLESQVAVKEANQARIPTVGIVDTNCDPDIVTYPIPANDDSVRSTNLICGVLGRAGEAGYKRRLSAVHAYKGALGIPLEEPVDRDAAGSANTQPSR